MLILNLAENTSEVGGRPVLIILEQVSTLIGWRFPVLLPRPIWIDTSIHTLTGLIAQLTDYFWKETWILNKKQYWRSDQYFERRAVLKKNRYQLQFLAVSNNRVLCAINVLCLIFIHLLHWNKSLMKRELFS